MAESFPQPETPTAAHIGPDDPVPLAVAAKLFFPAGGVTLSSLRNEIRRGTLVPERIANKLFVTRRAIDAMRDRCRDDLKARDSMCAGSKASRPSIPSGTGDRVSAACASALVSIKKLKEHSRNTSPSSTTRAPAKVIRGKF